MHTDTATGVRRSAILEGIQVRLDGGQIDAMFLCALREHHWIVDALSARHDFLAAHKEVI
jgi:hypothetical protein